MYPLGTEDPAECCDRGRRKDPLVLPLQSLKSSSNSPKRDFRDNTFCNWQQQEVKFYIPAPELRAH